MSLLASQPEARLELLGKLQGMDFAGLSGRFAHHPSLPFDRSPDPEP